MRRRAHDRTQFFKIPTTLYSITYILVPKIHGNWFQDPPSNIKIHSVQVPYSKGIAFAHASHNTRLYKQPLYCIVQGTTTREQYFSDPRCWVDPWTCIYERPSVHLLMWTFCVYEYVHGNTLLCLFLCRCRGASPLTVVSMEELGILGTRQWVNWILGSLVVIDRPFCRIFTKRIQNWNTACGCFSWSLR